jgi:hypothetical protein
VQGGVSGAVAKTMTAPIERVKLLIQTQDANPKARHHAAARRRLLPCVRRRRGGARSVQDSERAGSALSAALSRRSLRVQRVSRAVGPR